MNIQIFVKLGSSLQMEVGRVTLNKLVRGVLLDLWLHVQTLSYLAACLVAWHFYVLQTLFGVAGFTLT